MGSVSWGSFTYYAAKQGKEHKGNHRDMERRQISFDISLLTLLWGDGKKANYFEVQYMNLWWFCDFCQRKWLSIMSSKKDKNNESANP